MSITRVEKIQTNREWDEVLIPENLSLPVEEPFWLEFISIDPVASLHLDLINHLAVAKLSYLIFVISFTLIYIYINDDLQDFSKESEDRCIFWKDHSSHRNVPG